MEPPGRLPPELILRNPPDQQQQMPQCIKPTSLNLQPLIELPAPTQPMPSSTQASSGSKADSSPAVVATASSAATSINHAAPGNSHNHPQHHHHAHQPQRLTTTAAAGQHLRAQSSASTSGSTTALCPASSTGQQQQQSIEKLSRPMTFDKMEGLVREMQDQEHGVPVRQQKIFLTSIPYAFMGYDLIEWLMDRLQVEESEALNIANQLCLHGYFFPVNDSKTLTIKDDSSLYRFQTPYYWPWQHKAPDNVEYAIYLAKRSLRNKQRHALEDYEAEALTSLHKNLKGKWDFISMQAEEQVRLAKERKKGDKIVGDSQERAYWRVHRPPPGQFTPLEPCPVPSRDRQGLKPNKRKAVDDIQREVDYLQKSLNRTRMKMSQACESLVAYSETFSEYDFFLQPVLPSNPWVTEDIAFWQLNSTFVDIPTEKRVKRWAISIEELVSDPTGLHEFTTFLEREYSHENIRFWLAVKHLRRSAHSQVVRKVNEIFEEFLKPGAPCEINIDGKTMEGVLRGLKNPSRFTFDSASEHIYMLLLKKDCYPRFVRSEHYKRLLDTGIQPSHKKRFFNFGGVSGAKKKMTTALSSQPNIGDLSKGSTSSAGGSAYIMQAMPPCDLSRRRGSDRSLAGSAHELVVIGTNKDAAAKVPHSHSQNNLCEIPYRESSETKFGQLETTAESFSAAASAVCPWDVLDTVALPAPAQVKLPVFAWDQKIETPNTTLAPSSPVAAITAAAAAADIGDTLAPVAAKANASDEPQPLTSICPEKCGAGERLQRNFGIRHQHTVDSGETGLARLMPNSPKQRRASVSFTPSAWKHLVGSTSCPTTTSSPVVNISFPPLEVDSSCIFSHRSISSITKDQPASNDVEAALEGELIMLSLTQCNSAPSGPELPIVSTPAPKAITPPITKPKECAHVDPSSSTSAPPECPAPSLSINANVAPAVSIVKELQIELIEPHAQDSKELQLELVSELQKSVVASSNGESQSQAKIKTPVKILIESQIKATDDAAASSSLVEQHVQESAEAEISPTTDEYQEGMHFGETRTDAVYDYGIVDTEGHLSYKPPTPAPPMAPLAVLDVDSVEDEPFDEPTTITTPTPAPAPAVLSNEEARQRSRKRSSDAKELNSLNEKNDKDEKAGGSAPIAAVSDQAQNNAVCPWEDENVSSTDGSFVKTYSTLGYL